MTLSLCNRHTGRDTFTSEISRTHKHTHIKRRERETSPSNDNNKKNNLVQKGKFRLANSVVIYIKVV